MKDIVERLRCNTNMTDDCESVSMDDAANEIESLRARVKEFRHLYTCANNDANELAKEIGQLHARIDELENHSKSALVRFAECNGYDETDPIERFRFYCSLAMRGQDWLDVEQFFDALKASQGEPVTHQFQDRAGNWCNFSGQKHYENTVADGSWPIRSLYTSAPTIPEGWKLVPIEPTEEMTNAAYKYAPTLRSKNRKELYKAILASAPEYKGEEQ